MDACSVVVTPAGIRYVHKERHALNQKTITIKEVILSAIIAIICGILYKVWGPVYDFVGALTGFLNQFIYGVWFIASIIAAYIIRKPGVAFFTGLAAASGELLTGSQYGFSVLFSGAIQSLGAELVLMCFRYKRWDLPVLMLMSAAATAGSFLIDYTMWGYGQKTVFVQTMSLILRTLGSLFVCGWLGKWIVDALAKTGVLNSYAVVRSKQKAEWERS